MELEEYLERIKSCPDEVVNYETRGEKSRASLLTLELGIYDNFELFLNTQKENLEDFLSKSNYTWSYNTNYGGKTSSTWNYNPGTAIASVKKWNNEEERIKHIRKAYKNFRVSVGLHPYQGNDKYHQGIKDTSVPWQRSLALVILDLGNWALQNKIPLLIPHSIGWKYIKEIDWENLESHPMVVRYDPYKSP